MLAKEEYN